MALTPRFRRLTHLSNRCGCILQRFITKAFVGSLFYISAFALLTVLYHYAAQYQFQTVGIIALTPLAILIGFSGLMYNRTRAIEAKPHRFRSLYAAERLMASCYYYLIAVVLGFIITVFLHPFAVEEHLPSKDTLAAMYSPVILFYMMAFTELFLGVFAVRPRPYSRYFKLVARRTKRLQQEHADR